VKELSLARFIACETVHSILRSASLQGSISSCPQDVAVSSVSPQSFALENVSTLAHSNTYYTYYTSHFLGTCPVGSDPKSKQVSWRIPESLRRRLNSHVEYLSIEEETDTEDMVTQWLEDRLAIEERARALRTLAIEEKDLPKRPR
jgi:hypothetical protein